MRGRIIKWVSKRAGIEQLSIEWELGSGDDGYIAGQVTYAEPEVSDLSKPSAAMGKFLMDAQYAFTLEPYVNGTPAPTLVTKEVDMAVAAPFLLVNPDFSKTEVVKAYIHSHHCCSCDRLLETDNRRQERGSAGANEGSAYFQPAASPGQQDLGV